MHCGVQGHHAMSENRRVPRHVRNVHYGQRSVAQCLRRAATCQQIPAEFVQCSRKIHYSRLVINAQKRTWHVPSLTQHHAYSETIRIGF